MVGPLINAFLGKTSQIELAIASYALALSMTQLVLSFFTYIHQIVLSFYNDHPKKVKAFTLLIGIIPTSILALFCYTPLGPFFIETILGANVRLAEATLQSLRIFMIMTAVFPFIDFINGILLLRSQTKMMVVSQTANLAITFVVLLIASTLAPGWNGMIGALAQSLGMAGELVVLISIVLKSSYPKRALSHNSNKQVG